MQDAKHSSAIELVMVPIPEGRMEFDKKIEAYLPPAFVAGPMRYFEEQGADIRTAKSPTRKTGVQTRPGLGKGFPGLAESGRRRASGRMLALDFRTSRPFARIAQRGVYYIVAENVPGFR